MDICTECNSVEQGFTEDNEGLSICSVCGMEDSKKSYDEDYGQDR